MRPTLRLLSCLPLLLAACGGPPSVEEPAPVVGPVRPLAPLVTQQVIVAPLNGLAEADALGWTQQIPRTRDFMRAFDAAFQAELGARGLGTRWVFPEALARASRLNPSYSVDPYAIAAAPLRRPEAVTGARLGDPLASQLRTMVALQESARLVLLPVDLRFDRIPDGRGVAVLRLALLDARASDVLWLGDVRSEPASTYSAGLVTSLAGHVADLIAAP